MYIVKWCTGTNLVLFPLRIHIIARARLGDSRWRVGIAGLSVQTGIVEIDSGPFAAMSGSMDLYTSLSLSPFYAHLFFLCFRY